MFEVHIKAEGPGEEKLMSALQAIFDKIQESYTIVDNEAAEVRAAITAFKEESAQLREQIAQLREQIAQGETVNPEDVDRIIDLLATKDARVSAIFTPEDGPTPPSGPGE